MFWEIFLPLINPVCLGWIMSDITLFIQLAMTVVNILQSFLKGKVVSSCFKRVDHDQFFSNNDIIPLLANKCNLPSLIASWNTDSNSSLNLLQKHLWNSIRIPSVPGHLLFLRDLTANAISSLLNGLSNNWHCCSVNLGWSRSDK